MGVSEDVVSSVDKKAPAHTVLIPVYLALLNLLSIL